MRKKTSWFLVVILVLSLLFFYLNYLKTNFKINIKNHLPETSFSKPIFIEDETVQQKSNNEFQKTHEQGHDSSNQIEKSNQFLEENPNKRNQKKMNLNDGIELLMEGTFLQSCSLFDGQSEKSKIIKKFFNKINYGEDKEKLDLNLLRLDKVNNMAAKMSLYFFMFSLPTQRKILELLSEEGTSIFKEARFSYLMYESKKELEEHLPQAHEIQLRAYYSYHLTKLFYMIPNNNENSELLDICRQISDLNSKLDVQMFNELIVSSYIKNNLKPDDFGFKPTYKPHVVVSWGKGGFEYISKADYK